MSKTILPLLLPQVGCVTVIESGIPSVFVSELSIESPLGVLTVTVELFPPREQLFTSSTPTSYSKPAVIFTDPGTPGILFESPSVNVWLPKVGFDLPISVPEESLRT